jgi:hypothetical protein
MAGFDPDIFGAPASQPGQGFDPDIFSMPASKSMPKKLDVANDEISKGARAFASKGGSDALGGLSQHVLNLAAGGVRGAGSIGATLAYPFDKAQDLYYGDRERKLSSLITGKTPLSRNEERRARIDENMQFLGAQPDSLMYQGGKIGAEIAGTLPVGGMLGKGAAAVLPAAGVSAPVVNALSSGLATGGFRVPGLTGLSGMGARIGTGAATGYASAGLIDPSQAETGALIGAVLPPAVYGAGRLGTALSDRLRNGAEGLMQSAVKPTLAQLRSGEAKTAIRTMLENGISPNSKGIEKLQALIDAADDKITQGIAGSDAQVFMPHVADRVKDTRAAFMNQASPENDIAAIDAVKKNFLNHPQHPSQLMSVQDAQKMKQGTYRILSGKFGEQGSASTEAQKALARGLKEEIATAVPGVSEANAELAKLLKTMSVAERRALMEGNKNPGGLSLLAGNKAGLLAFLADRSANLKALTARGLFSASNVPAGGLLDNPALIPYVRQGLLASEANP